MAMKQTYQAITQNLANSPVRTDTLHGRKHLVAPLVMLTEGVHNGSNGPLYYGPDEMGKFPQAWNMKPCVVYHPEANGSGVSACDKAVLETHAVGMLMNTQYNGKLRAEAWLDEDRCRKVDERVLEHLETNTVMEVSTGLFTENEAAPEGSTWGGKPYSEIARNFRPDHLALLPDKVGACSVADGAGLLQLNEAATAAGVDLGRLLGPGLDYARRVVGNAMSHDDIRSALHTALQGTGLGMDDFWLLDVFPKYVVYHQSGKMYKQPYTMAKNAVTVTGAPTEVVRVTEYKPVKPLTENALDDGGYADAVMAGHYVQKISG